MKMEFLPRKEKDKTAFYLAELEKMRLTLLEEIQVLNEEEIDKSVSAVDFPSANQDRVRREELLNNAHERLQEIDGTIAWANEKGFTCRICGKEIEDERLEADPASITCREHVNQEDEVLNL